MTLPRVRFTVRRMMVAVAAVAACSAIVHLVALSRRYERESMVHWLLRMVFEVEGNNRCVAYHERMGEKYDRAARYPFLPVAPDPPEPE
jgi:hypothetical protein